MRMNKSSNERTNKGINKRINIRTNKSVKHTHQNEYKNFKNLPETINCHPNPGAGQYGQGNIQLTQRFQQIQSLNRDIDIYQRFQQIQSLDQNIDIYQRFQQSLNQDTDIYRRFKQSKLGQRYIAEISIDQEPKPGYRCVGQTVEPISSNFLVGPHMITGKVFSRTEFKGYAETMVFFCFYKILHKINNICQIF